MWKINKSIHSDLHYYLAIAIAFCLPFGRLTPIFIALFLLNWLIEGDLKKKLNGILHNKFVWLFVSFYFVHLIGIIHTKNVPSGMFDLEVKLSILVFPLILSSRPLSVKQINFIFTFFILGGLLSSVAMLTRAIYFFFVSGENKFFYEAFSFLVHPSYLSMYFNLIIVWLLLGVLKKGEIRADLKPLYSWILIVFFSFINLLLSSKMGMLSMVIIFLSFGIYYVLLSKMYFLGVITIILFVSAIVFSSIYIPAIEHRVSFAIAALTKKEISKTSDESSEVRILIWKAANGIVVNNLIFGVGTGDAKDALINEYENRGMTGAIAKKLNAHNEYYQVFVALGIIGFAFLLANLFLPFSYAFQTKNVMYILFLLLIIVNFLVESMLETQAGVMFYSFFNSLFCFNSYYINNNIVKQNHYDSNS